MLTKEDLAALQYPFKAAEHEFLKDKAYITEGAITDRIEQVDPSWTLEQISLYARPDSNQVVCTMRLTIKGVWRDGVGMTAITKLKSGAGDANEAEKSAATDALKRAARLFGIGRYLLDLPPNVVNEDSLRKYLTATYANTAPPLPPASPAAQPVFDGVNPPVSEQALDWEAQERIKVQAAMDTEAVSIFKIRYTPTQNGMGLPCWTATARMINGGTFPITVWTEHVSMVKKMGYAWPDTDADDVDILVITEARGSERRIKTVLPKENPFGGKVAENAGNGQPDTTVSAWVVDLPALYKEIGQRASHVNLNERTNTIQKMHREGEFAKVGSLGGAVQMVLSRLEAHAAKRNKGAA